VQTTILAQAAAGDRCDDRCDDHRPLISRFPPQRL